MISSVRGKLVFKNPSKIILETSGIGLEIFISAKTFEKLPSEGEVFFIETYMHVREESIILIGFLSKKEKELFLKIIGVSGVSIKIALSSLSIYSPEDLIKFIVSSHADMLKRVPGIGGKLADRIILELKGKLEEDSTVGLSRDLVENDKIIEVKEALKTLGYSTLEANKALSKINPEEISRLNLEEILRKALKEA